MRRIGICMLLLALLVSCGNNTGTINPSDVVNIPATADGKVNKDNLPVFEFKEELHDFGRIGQGEVVSHVFTFTNMGKSDLVISTAKASCGCTVADYPKFPVKPGEQGEVTIKYDSEGRRGMQTKTLTLIANTDPNTKVLTIKAEIVVPEEK